MPKSKRNKQISLTRTHKNALQSKKQLVEEVHSCIDKYARLFIFSVNNMRNSKLKDVRQEWRHSRILYGKNKVMALALGRDEGEEYRPNLHKMSNQLKGQCGLLFSNQSKDEVLQWFQEYSDPDFARSGNAATYSVELAEGPVPEFHYSLEPYLRQLGMPTELKKGVVHMLKNYQVCKEGEILTPEKAKILELTGHQMAEFRITIECFWSNDGTFMELQKSSTMDTDENDMEIDGMKEVSHRKKNGDASEDEQLDMDDDDEGESEEDIKVVKSVPVEVIDNDDEEKEKAEDISAPVEVINGKDDQVVKGISAPVEVNEVEVKSIHAPLEVIGSDNEVTNTESTDNVEEKDNIVSATPVKATGSNNTDINSPKNVVIAASDSQEGVTTAVTPLSAKAGFLEGKDDPSPFRVPGNKSARKGKKQVQEVQSSPDEKSPVFRSLRNRTVKIKRKK